MTFDNVTEFAGLAVVPFEGDFTTDVATTMPRITANWDADADAWVEQFNLLRSLPVAASLRGLSIGAWGEPYENSSAAVAAAVRQAAADFPQLTTLVFADLSYEEAEVSWIENSELGPMLNAYPGLTSVLVRGGNQLGLTDLKLPQLTTLVVQTGGLDRSVVTQLLTAELPSLTRLELYLGDSNYGANVTVDDLASIISGETFPLLTYLGLKNSELEDELAAALTSSPRLGQLKTLDLSLGTLSDVGGQALLAAKALDSLKLLDLQYHYLSEPVANALKERFGDRVNLAEPQETEDYGPYVSIGE